LILADQAAAEQNLGKIPFTGDHVKALPGKTPVVITRQSGRDHLTGNGDRPEATPLLSRESRECRRETAGISVWSESD
jgi:hypothetical protein